MGLGAIRYGGPFFFAGSIPAFYYSLGQGAPLLTIIILLLVLIGAEALSPRGEVPAPHSSSAIFRMLPLLYIPLQLGVIAWAIAQAGHLSALGFIALALSTGVTTGVFGVLAAHELIHGHDRVEKAFGLAMLSGMTYRHFRIAHVHGHHRWAATELDPATAHLGEGFYGFLLRTISGQFMDAWRIENKRTAARRYPLLANRIARDVVAMACLYAAILWLAGWRGALLFAAQSLTGIIVLELFNYIAHYGLLRTARGQGREPFGPQHSWNSSNVIANAMIFNMGRHTHHHARPASPYQNLQYAAAAPELPAGYAGSILLALVPILWRRVMDPAVQRLQTSSSNTPA